MDINPELEDGLKVKQIIDIPYKKTYVEIQKIKSQEKNVHVVQAGETLYSVSKKYGVSIGDLLKWNGMDLKAGQEIVVGYDQKVKPETNNTSLDNKNKVVKEEIVLESEVVPLKKEEIKVQAEKVTESRTSTVVLKETIPAPMTRNQILAAEEVYDYDSTMKQVLIVPFDPHLYFSDADDEIAASSKIPRVIHLLGGQFADSVADLNKIYTSVTYNYQEILYSDNYEQNVPPVEPDKSVKGWMDRQKEKMSGITSATNTKSIDHGRFEGKYFGVRVKDMNFFEFYHYKYSIDYYVFINQFEVVTDYEHCLDRAAQNYQRYFITHFTVFNKKGNQIAGNKFKVHYDSNSNDIYKIVADNMQKISQRVINELPNIKH